MCHCIFFIFLDCKLQTVNQFCLTFKTKAEFRHGLSGANAHGAGQTMSHICPLMCQELYIHTLNTVDSYKCLYGKPLCRLVKFATGFHCKYSESNLSRKLKTDSRKVNVLLFKELLC